MTPEYKRNAYLPGIHHQDMRPGDEPYLLMPGGGGIKFFLANLVAAWGGSFGSYTVLADIYDMDMVLIENSATVYDPLGTFASLTSSAWLEVKKQGGKYYANQAPCPL